MLIRGSIEVPRTWGRLIDEEFIREDNMMFVAGTGSEREVKGAHQRGSIADPEAYYDDVRSVYGVTDNGGDVTLDLMSGVSNYYGQMSILVGGEEVYRADSEVWEHIPDTIIVDGTDGNQYEIRVVWSGDDPYGLQQLYPVTVGIPRDGEDELTLAIVRAKVTSTLLDYESDNTSAAEKLLRAIRRAVDDWALDHEHGRAALIDSCCDFNIGDLGNYLAVEFASEPAYNWDEDRLEAYLHREGVLTLDIDIYTSSAPHSWRFDTPLFTLTDEQIHGEPDPSREGAGES